MKIPGKGWWLVLERKCGSSPVLLRSLTKGHDFVNGLFSTRVALGLAPGLAPSLAPWPGPQPGPPACGFPQ